LSAFEEILSATPILISDPSIDYPPALITLLGPLDPGLRNFLLSNELSKKINYNTH
jgi:hypothetical protein